MEKFPEQPPKQEVVPESEHAKLVRLLAERGYEDQEVRQLMIQWQIEEEKKHTGPDQHVQVMKFQAKLLSEAGLDEEALDQLYQAFQIAEQEGFTELADELDALAPEYQAKVQREK